MSPKREPFPGLGDRLAVLLKREGFWKADRPDVRKFCEEHRFLSQSVYQWLDDTTPSYSNLIRLAAILKVAPGWLLLGDRMNEIPRTEAREEQGVPKEPLRRSGKQR